MHAMSTAFFGVMRRWEQILGTALYRLCRPRWRRPPAQRPPQPQSSSRPRRAPPRCWRRLLSRPRCRPPSCKRRSRLHHSRARAAARSCCCRCPCLVAVRVYASAAHAAVLAHAAASLVARRLSPCAQGPAGTQRLQNTLLVSIAWTLYGHLRDASHNCLHSRPVTSSVSSIRLWPRAALLLPAALLPACALRVCTQYRMHSACSWRTARARRARQAARRIGPDPSLAVFSCNIDPRSHVASLLRRVHKHAAQPRGAWR